MRTHSFRAGLLSVGVLLGSASAQTDEAAEKIPACMVIDDGAPFVNMRWVKDKTVCEEIPTSFYREFGDWAKREGIRGKFSVVPCIGGIKPIDGSLGEYPGHSADERLEWIRLVNTLLAPRFTITPEMITHWHPWDVENQELREELPMENAWLAEQSLAVQTAYVTESMRILRRAGIDSQGLTMCWSYPAEKNHVLGEATLRAAEEVLGLDYVILFNDTGAEPGVIFRDDDGAMTVSLRPKVGDVYSHTFGGKTEDDILRDADVYLTSDGQRGQFADQIREGSCLIFYTHIQTLYGNGTRSGMKVFEIAIERLEENYGDRIQWMTGREICEHFCPPTRR